MDARASKRGRCDSADGAPTVDCVHSNPHLRQAEHGYQSRADIAFSRLLLPDAPRGKYRRRTDELKTVMHWGQRKLLLAEIEFLTEYAVSGATVLYAGAAPGTHTRYLIELFPDLKFVLVDPAPFSGWLTQLYGDANARCVLRHELFTDAVAAEYAGRDDVLFVSDIRSCDWLLYGAEDHEDRVLQDMQAQQRWHDILRPVKSLLKFRLPWTAGATEYLAGDVYLPAFGPITTTETRLVPHGHARVAWDHKTYEEQLFHFNTVTRVGRYAHAMPVGAGGEGLDYCYDCRSEVEVLSRYLRMRDGEAAPAAFCAMSARCSRECASGRTLLDANSDPEEKTRVIRRHQWVAGRPAYER